MNTLAVELSLIIYPIEAIRRAAYAVADRVAVELRAHDRETVLVSLTPRKSATPISANEFRDLVLDFALRIELEAKTADVRKTIVNAALAEALGPRPPKQDR